MSSGIEFNEDDIPALKTEHEIALKTGDVYDWSNQPEPFRFIVNGLRLKRLVRNAESVSVFVFAMGHPCTVQKAGAMAMIEASRNDDDASGYYAATFNGSDLLILGAL